MNKQKDLSKVASFVQSIIDKKTMNSEELFKEIMAPKILNALAAKRMEIAGRIFREAVDTPFVLINPLELDPETKKPKVLCSGTKEECMGYKNNVKDAKVRAALKIQPAK